MEFTRFGGPNYLNIVGSAVPIWSTNAAAPTSNSPDRAIARANQVVRPLQRIWYATDRHAVRPAGDFAVGGLSASK